MVIVGAGSAGIAAARHLLAHGLTVTVLEARDRIGGRTVTRSFKGHPLDLGAHWLHAGPINPLVKLGRERGEPLRRAPVDGHFFVRGRPGRRAESAALDRAFAMADRAMTQGAKAREDQAAAKALPPMGPQGRRVAAIHGLVSGRPLDEVSLHDFPSMEYADNLFIAGGLGAYVSRLAEDCRSVSGPPSVHRLVGGRRAGREQRRNAARRRPSIVTTPMAVLQQDTIRFAPALPNAVQEAIHGFTQGVYEHVVLHWPDSPFRGADRLASLTGQHREPPGLLTCIDGTPFHFFELDQPSAASFDRRDAHAPLPLCARGAGGAFRPPGHPQSLRPAQHRVAQRSLVARLLGRGAAGASAIRDILKAPVGERIWFAGEALSRAQWGTAGGAWEEGERAAGEIVATS